MSNITLVVKIKVKEQFSDEVYIFMKALHKLTNEFDEGCIQYDLHKVKDQKSTFCFIETWEDQISLDKHKEKEHYKNFMQYMEDKTENVQMDFLEKYIEEV